MTWLKGSVFRRGVFRMGVFRRVVLRSGVFRECVFHRGVLRSGGFRRGVFHKGVFRRSVFRRGVVREGVCRRINTMYYQSKTRPLAAPCQRILIYQGVHAHISCPCPLSLGSPCPLLFDHTNRLEGHWLQNRLFCTHECSLSEPADTVMRCLYHKEEHTAQDIRVL